MAKLMLLAINDNQQELWLGAYKYILLKKEYQTQTTENQTLGLDKIHPVRMTANFVIIIESYDLTYSINFQTLLFLGHCLWKIMICK